MVAIAPFRALRYAPGVDLRKVTSPPHDVIGPDERDGFLARDPRNIVHVVLGREEPGDAEAPASPNRYERACVALETWQQKGVLVRDERPAFYMYEVRHGSPGARTAMRGFFCRVALDPSYHEIRRHEKTLAKKKSDRLRLLEATDCNTEPIWLLYRDERGWVDEVLSSNAFDELARFTDEEGSEHRLWRVDRDEAVLELISQFEERTLVIADGHHRYETALKHYAATGRAEDGSILVCLVRDTDPGVRIEPTHRLVRGLPFDAPDAAVAAAGAWDAEPVDLPDDASAGPLLRDALGIDDRSCIVVGRHGTDLRAWILRLREGHEVDEGRGALDSLAVVRVHERLLRDAWGIGDEDVEGHLGFTQRHDEAVRAVLEGRCQLAVLLAPEPVHAVLDIASQGHLMPQKATYFVPKLRSGVVLGPLDEPPPRPWQELAGDGGRMEFRMPPLD